MLSLPMTPRQCADAVIAPTFLHLLPGRFDSLDARALLLAITLQESNLEARLQVGGPARGLWQFEQGGGVHGVLNHDASRLYMRSVCLLRAVAPNDGDLYRAIGHDDLLACATARMLLYTDPNPLPDAPQAALAYYLRNWRPGAYKRDPDGIAARFVRNYAIARQVYP